MYIRIYIYMCVYINVHVIFLYIFHLCCSPSLLIPSLPVTRSQHPSAMLHAVARAVGGCAVYVSDAPGSLAFSIHLVISLSLSISQSLSLYLSRSHSLSLHFTLSLALYLSRTLCLALSLQFFLDRELCGQRR